MNKTFQITEDVFRSSILFLCADSITKMQRRGKQACIDYKKDDGGIDITVQSVSDGSGGSCATRRGDAVIAVITDVSTPQILSNLVHEIEHAVFDILDQRGMKHSDDSDEAYAYLMGYYSYAVFSELKIK